MPDASQCLRLTGTFLALLVRPTLLGGAVLSCWLVLLSLLHALVCSVKLNTCCAVLISRQRDNVILAAC